MAVTFFNFNKPVAIWHRLFDQNHQIMGRLLKFFALAEKAALKSQMEFKVISLKFCEFIFCFQTGYAVPCVPLFYVSST
jgi:hypothetical protein